MHRSRKVLHPLAACAAFCAAVAVALTAAVNATTGAAAPAGPRAVDPRADGFEVALGEWSVVTEARSIRPGHVRIVVTNRGRLAHGLRVRATEHEGGDGRHGGDGLGRTRVLAPGAKATLDSTSPRGRTTSSASSRTAAATTRISACAHCSR